MLLRRWGVVAACLGVLSVAACGGSAQPRAANGGTTTTAAVRSLAGAWSAARAAGTVTFRFAGTRRPVGGGQSEDGVSGSGALDLDADAGAMTVDLSALLAGVPGAPGTPLGKPFTLRWAGDTLWARDPDSGGWRQSSRGDSSTGMVGRLPSEPAGLLRMLSAVDGAERRGDVWHATVDLPTVAAGFGVPADGNGAAASGRYGDALDVDVALDGDGRPTRISYRMHTPPPAGGLPAHEVNVTYRYADWGRPVDGVGQP